MGSKIKQLVCSNCWQHLFSHEPFEKAWSADPGLEYVTPSWAEMQESINLMCEWCDILSEEILFYYQHITKSREEPPQDATFSVLIRFMHRKTTEPLKLSITVGDWTHVYLVWTTPDDIAALHIDERGIMDKLDTPEAYSTVLRCLNTCASSHSRCPSPAPADLPTRVIDCSNLEAPRLLERDETAPPAHYAALSYVWGEAQLNCTTRARLPDYLKRIDMDCIPRTIRDAIKATSALGLRCLWVDAFCIIQDCEEDKAKEIAQIHIIFRDCFITIIAANAAKASDGIFGRTILYNSPSTVPFICPANGGGVGTMRLQSREDAPKEPIDTRAWCFEGRILSARAIWYCTHTVQYECQHGHVNVDGSENMAISRNGFVRLPERLFTPKLRRNFPLKNDIVQDDKLVNSA